MTDRAGTDRARTHRGGIYGAGTDRAVSIAVVGAGVSGLVAAYRLRCALGPTAHIQIVEAGDRPGGQLAYATVGGREVDVGAEAFVVRRREAVDLIAELGLTEHLVSPTGARPALLADGRLHNLPRPTLMGVPAGPDAVAHVIADADVPTMLGERDRPLRWTPGADCSLGELVANRFGPSVVDRSVDPMLSGVYSARAGDIGVRAALPQLAERLDAGAPSLSDAVASLLPPQSALPIFGALDGGYRVLVDTLHERAAATTRLRTRVRAIGREGSGWAVHTDDTVLRVDAVVIAVPAPVAATLLVDVAPETAAALADVRIAGSAVVAVAIDPRVGLPERSGVLVATGEDTTAKAITFSSRKWSHLDQDGLGLARVSFGRLGDPVDDVDDDVLVAAAVDDLATVCGLAGSTHPPSGADVVDAVVQRWPVGLPQYAPGHRDLVARVDAHRPHGLVICGATFEGVGVPACIGRAGRAAAQVVGDLQARHGEGVSTANRGGTMGT